jgi:hypothetical protein
MRPLNAHNDRPSDGLCAKCVHRKEIRSDRGSVFVMCLRSFKEPEFPKYPRLPVLQCPGYERIETA